MNTGHQEVELKLTALDEGTLKEVAAWMELGGHLLISAPARTMRDRYWDTPEGKLAAFGVSLRQRRIRLARYFTLKGEASVVNGLFRRFEVEVEANSAGWDLILATLAERGVHLPHFPAIGDDPTSWLHSAGLTITQERATYRQLRLAQRDGATLAELALDRTTFMVEGLEITMREIEIEATTANAEPVLTLGRELRGRLGSRVRESTLGKYGLGLLIASRLAGVSSAAGHA